jgi:NAD(P)-dependent dehydrogenase (short-subunit alcohol dehydrogenase family)
MKKKHILITGATSGIGRAAARALGNMGAQISFTGHRGENDQRIAETLRRETGNPDIHVFECDLASLHSVADFCRSFREAYRELDILINNAGVWNPERELTRDGIERHLAVNHLAPFLMTRQLLPLLESPSHARIINLTSGIHFRGKLDLDDLEFERRKWRSIDAYTQSKLCNVLFTRSLARQLTGTHVSANCLAPGWVNTGLFRQANPLVRMSASLLAMRPEKAASSLVYLATAIEIGNVSGEYFAGKNPRKSAPASYDEQLADKLWKKSTGYLKDYP